MRLTIAYTFRALSLTALSLAHPVPIPWTIPPAGATGPLHDYTSCIGPTGTFIPISEGTCVTFTATGKGALAIRSQDGTDHGFLAVTETTTPPTVRILDSHPEGFQWRETAWREDPAAPFLSWWNETGTEPVYGPEWQTDKKGFVSLYQGVELGGLMDFHFGPYDLYDRR
ncbi:hypothetical protein BJY04DRAFT_219022 [Aspergillus karnatakaensis]|uniref:uncharacterized protein n=1 Tax=Aspergillus karnatakaensis TaxID=1810916 RepID=UPI003CCCF379